MTIDQSIEAFVRGLTFTRSYTHPFLAEKIGGVWAMQDAERKRGDYRTEEYVAHRADPADVDAVARRRTRGKYVVDIMCAMDETDEPIRARFKELGYRMTWTEALMAHSLERIEPCEPPLPVVQVTTQEMADKLNRAARKRQILPAHLQADPPPMRQYMALDGDRPVGWAQSIAAGDVTWCSSVYVHPEYRRRGIARGLMRQILLDDRDAGSRANVLLASHAGAHLYAAVGYVQIGKLFMFMADRKEQGRDAA